jgi:protoheme IX farnesyltransferase
MKRTALRPLAAGRLPSLHALVFAVILSTCGFFYLLLAVNHLTGLLSALVFAGYLFLYTPLKTRTWLSIFIGAVPGALPVVMGWTAATASISSDAWILFMIVFLWQIPHFHAIAWLHREDYARAGIRMMATADETGRRTGILTVCFIAILFAGTIIPFLSGLGAFIYLTGAVVLGLGFLGFGVHFARFRSRASARLLFACSAVYLPALLALLMLDRWASR